MPLGALPVSGDEDALANRKNVTSPEGTSDEIYRKEHKFIVDLIYKCYAKLLRETQSPTNGTTVTPSEFCPVTFDGYACWDATPARETAQIPCPAFVNGFDPTRLAFRHCLENGSWFRHPETGKEWSNYTTCVDVEDLALRQSVNHIYIIGYSVSLLTLLISLVIFLSFRSLRCTRIAIHVQLFVSLAVNNILWIVWYRFVVEDVDVVRDNRTWCQCLHVLLHYFMVSNYLWMFCEGLHLHIALVIVFVQEKIVMRWFHLAGWALPLLLTATYAAVRAHMADTHRCWMNDSLTTWILTVPVLISITANLVFLVNVVRVLFTKLHHESVPLGLRKAVRATLILVPLFGLQHILIPFRPLPGDQGETVYQVFSAIIVSLQGFCVSVLFCFANVDVHCAFKRLFYVLGAHKDSRVTGGGTTLQDLNTNTRDI